jgi:hypothetical protein
MYGGDEWWSESLQPVSTAAVASPKTSIIRTDDTSKIKAASHGTTE